MRRVKAGIFVFIFACLANIGKAQNPEHIIRFFGTDSFEDLNPYDVERLEDYLSSPLDINRASETRLKESGLLTRYQQAALADYRARHGDIMSLTELAAVDGFGNEFVSRLAPFITLDSGQLPGTAVSRRIGNELSIRTSVRRGELALYGLKYKLTAVESLSAGLSVSRTSSAATTAPNTYSGHISYHFRRKPGKLVIGDFNARFGQGLALWNGMSFSGLNSSSSFMKRPSGISASSSFTGEYALRGLAADIGFGRMNISVLAAAAQNKGTFSAMPAVNASWLFKNGQISMTHYADFMLSSPSVWIPDMKTAADAAFCLKGTDLFSELAFDWVSAKFAFLGGISSSVGENLRLAAMLRYYPASYSSGRSAAARSTTNCSNEYALSAAVDFNFGKWMKMRGPSVSDIRRLQGKFSVDFACFPEAKIKNPTMRSMQLKAQTEWAFMISESFRTGIRFSERIRTWGDTFRTDLRTDFSYSSEHFIAAARLNLVSCLEMGLLGYLEGGYHTARLAFYARTGMFRIDKWADRIYVYERDAPGSFNLPAYYGRGVWAAMTMNWKFAKWGRAYLRAAMTSYPFMSEKKPGRAELKIQFVFRL